MSNGDSEFVRSAAVHIMGALISNPHVLGYNLSCGWNLVNCTPAQLADYAWHLARQLEASQSQPLPNPPGEVKNGT